MRKSSLPRAIRSAAGLTLLTAALLVAPPPAAAQPQDVVTLQVDPAEREAARERLFAALKAARNEPAARQLVSSIWLLWFQAPDEPAAELMRQALEHRRSYDYRGALEVLDRLVGYAPDWAEGWNQRATLRFLVEDFDGSLEDIDKVLPLEPKHFGALSGEALILRHLGRHAESQAALRRAVEINPFLIERVLLDAEPESKDI